MADKDPEDKPSLELPSFGFGRKKKGKSAEPTVAPSKDAPSAPVDRKPRPSPGPTPSATPSPTPSATPKPTTPKPNPTRSPATPPPVTPAPLAPELAPDIAEPDPVTPEPGPAPAAPQRRVERTDPHVGPVATPSPTLETRPIPVPTGRATAAAPAEPTVEPAQKREVSFPAIPALQAVLVVGALIGLLAVLLTFASLKFCEVARGTDSCGGSGWLLLIATVVLLTYVGSWLLRGFGIADPGSTSFLAVALLVVMVMVFLLDVIYNWWMILVIPPVSMATYALSWWVTTRLVEVDDGRS